MVSKTGDIIVGIVILVVALIGYHVSDSISLGKEQYKVMMSELKTNEVNFPELNKKKIPGKLDLLNMKVKNSYLMYTACKNDNACLNVSGLTKDDIDSINKLNNQQIKKLIKQYEINYEKYITQLPLNKEGYLTYKKNEPKFTTKKTNKQDSAFITKLFQAQLVKLQQANSTFKKDGSKVNLEKLSKESAILSDYVTYFKLQARLADKYNKTYDEAIEANNRVKEKLLDAKYN